MTPGSLTPLEENKSLDLGIEESGGDGGSSLDDDGGETKTGLIVDTTRVMMNGSTGSGSGSSSPLSGMPVISESVPNSGIRPGTRVVAGGTRIGLRRKSTGVGSPLVNCVATWESISSNRSSMNDDDEIADRDEEDVATPMSPLLMRTKDSLLLKDVQQRKKRSLTSSGMPKTPMTLDLKLSVSNSTPVGSSSGWSTLSEEIPFLTDAEAETQGLLSDNKEPPSSPSSHPFPSTPSQSTNPTTTNPQPLSPTQIPIPDTPTIGPCTMTMSGSKTLEEVISPLQLSSPALPLAVHVKDSIQVTSAWSTTPISIVALDLKLRSEGRRRGI